MDTDEEIDMMTSEDSDLEEEHISPPPQKKGGPTGLKSKLASLKKKKGTPEKVDKPKKIKKKKKKSRKKIKTQYKFDCTVESIDIDGQMLPYPLIITLARGGKVAQIRVPVFPLLKDITGFTGRGRFDYEEASYYGDFKDGHRHGRGSQMFHTGDSYVGSWLHDVYFGYGEYKMEDGLYEGNHVEGMWHGEGKYTWPNGDVYIGRFKENAFHGPGEKIYKKSKKVEAGYWQDDELQDVTPFGGDDGLEFNVEKFSSFTGFVTWTMDDGAHYEGEIILGKRENYGKMTFANGNVYQGEWLQDEFSGHGHFTSEKGSYDGNFLGGKWHGQGTFTWVCGDKYTGAFRESHFHGAGIKTFADGNPEQSGMWEMGIYKGLESQRVEADSAPPTSTAIITKASAKRKNVRAALLSQVRSGELESSLQQLEKSLASGPEPEPQSLSDDSAMVDIIAAFDAFDDDNSGCIDNDELKNCLVKLLGDAATDHVLEEAMKNADTDGNGSIEKEEFVEWVSESDFWQTHQQKLKAITEQQQEEAKARKLLAKKSRYGAAMAHTSESLSEAHTFRVNKMLSLLSKLESDKVEPGTEQEEGGDYKKKVAVLTVKQVYSIAKKGRKPEQKQKVLGSCKINLADYPAQAGEGNSWAPIKTEHFMLEPPAKDKRLTKKLEKRGQALAAIPLDKKMSQVVMHARMSCETVTLPGADDSSDMDSVVSAMSFDSDLGTLSDLSEFDEFSDDNLGNDSEDDLPLYVPYRCLKQCLVRSSFETDSEKVGLLQPGDQIKVLEVRTNENGQHRLKFELEGHQHEYGWVSVESLSGAIFLVKEDAQFEMAKIAAKVSLPQAQQIRLAKSMDSATQHTQESEKEPDSRQVLQPKPTTATAERTITSLVAQETQADSTSTSKPASIDPDKRKKLRAALFSKRQSGELEVSLNQLSVEGEHGKHAATHADLGDTSRAHIELDRDLMPTMDIEKLTEEIGPAESEEAMDQNVLHLHNMATQLQQKLDIATATSQQTSQQSNEEVEELSKVLVAAKKQRRMALVRSLRMAAKATHMEVSASERGQSLEHAKELRRLQNQIETYKQCIRDTQVLRTSTSSEEQVQQMLLRATQDLCEVRLTKANLEDEYEQLEKERDELKTMLIAAKLHLAQVEMSRQRIGVEAKRERRALIQKVKTERDKSANLGRRLASLEVSVARTSGSGSQPM